jgi:flagellin
MTVINTNTAATISANALTKNERAMSQAMERLSTGQRINSAADDAAGLAISSKMTSQINGLNMAVKNANDAISMVKTVDGAVIEITSMLQRMRELAVQAASDTNTNADQDSLDLEFQQLDDEIDRIATNTQWNGTKVLDGSLGAINFQVGANASQTIGITFADFQTNHGATEATDSGVDANSSAATDIFTNLARATADNDSSGGGSNGTDEAIDLDGLSINNTATHSDTITRLDMAISRVNSHRATLGAVINRLEYAADNLANVSQNASASRSRILDADYAAETTELARTQIIQQAGTAMLSQANQQAQSVLALLK